MLVVKKGTTKVWSFSVMHQPLHDVDYDDIHDHNNDVGDDDDRDYDGQFCFLKMM